MKSSSFTPLQRLKSILKIFKMRKFIIPMFKDFFSGRYKMPWGRMFLFVLTLGYLIWPIDIVPDFIIGLGWIDDIIVFSMASNLLEEELKKYKYFKESNNGQPVILTERWK